MAEMSNYLEEKLLDHTLGTTAYTHPSTVYLALHTADPTDAGSGAEVDVARQACAFTAAGSDGNGVTENSAVETFASMPACTVTHIGIWDHVSAGNLLYHTSVTTSKAVLDGDTITVAAGAVTVTLA